MVKKEYSSLWPLFLLGVVLSAFLGWVNISPQINPEISGMRFLVTLTIAEFTLVLFMTLIVSRLKIQTPHFLRSIFFYGLALAFTAIGPMWLVWLLKAHIPPMSSWLLH